MTGKFRFGFEKRLILTPFFIRCRTVSLWALFKKKPLAKVLSAHDSGKWITAIASLRNTDLFATGMLTGNVLTYHKYHLF